MDKGKGGGTALAIVGRVDLIHADVWVRFSGGDTLRRVGSEQSGSQPMC